MTKQSTKSLNTEQQLGEIQETLLNQVGPSLKTIYHLNSPAADGTNLVIAINSPSDIHLIRNAFQSIHNLTGFQPIVATSSALSRHLELNHSLAQHLDQYGRLLIGEPIPIRSTSVPIPESIGYLSGLAIDASSLLAPNLLQVGELETITKKLDHLSAFLGLNTHDSLPDPIRTISAIQARLSEMVESHPDIKWSIPAPTGAPPLLDALLAIYEGKDRAIFVLPDWPAEEIEHYINQVDWAAVSESLEDQYNGLQITTASQFRLMLLYDKPTDYYLQNYNHAWGINALAAFETPRWRIYQNLANLASTFEVQIFAQDYLAGHDDQINNLVHDYQNRLLNIQLQEELIHRLFYQERASPPNPLPSREAPGYEKIAAIFDQFSWWADHYTMLMNNHK